MADLLERSSVLPLHEIILVKVCPSGNGALLRPYLLAFIPVGAEGKTYWRIEYCLLDWQHRKRTCTAVLPTQITTMRYIF